MQANKKGKAFYLPLRRQRQDMYPRRLLCISSACRADLTKGYGLHDGIQPGGAAQL